MTLIIGMSKPEGIYVSVDFRLTNPITGAIYSDDSNKCLRVDYVPLEGGLRALLAFTGVGHIDGTPTLTWIRETLRGEPDTPDQSIQLLRERLNRDAASLRQPLIINILGLHGTRRFFGALSNMPSPPRARVLPEFQYVMQEVNASFMFTNGSGATTAIADDKLKRAQALLDIMPRAPMDYMKLLAIVNRRVAALRTSVSPFCHVHFISAVDQFGHSSHVFSEKGEVAPFSLEILFGGIDITQFTSDLRDQVEALSRGVVPPTRTTEEMNRGLQRRP